jgi:hypothetical protein
MYRKTRNSMIALTTSFAILASSAGFARAAESEGPSVEAAVMANLADVRTQLLDSARLAPLPEASALIAVGGEIPTQTVSVASPEAEAAIQITPESNEPARTARPDPMQMPFYRFGGSNGAGTGS